MPCFSPSTSAFFVVQVGADGLVPPNRPLALEVRRSRPLLRVPGSRVGLVHDPKPVLSVVCHPTTRFLP